MKGLSNTFAPIFAERGVSQPIYKAYWGLASASSASGSTSFDKIIGFDNYDNHKSIVGIAQNSSNESYSITGVYAHNKIADTTRIYYLSGIATDGKTVWVSCKNGSYGNRCLLRWTLDDFINNGSFSYHTSLSLGTNLTGILKDESDLSDFLAYGSLGNAGVVYTLNNSNLTATGVEYTANRIEKIVGGGKFDGVWLVVDENGVILDTTNTSHRIARIEGKIKAQKAKVLNNHLIIAGIYDNKTILYVTKDLETFKKIDITPIGSTIVDIIWSGNLATRDDNIYMIFGITQTYWCVKDIDNEDGIIVSTDMNIDTGIQAVETLVDSFNRPKGALWFSSETNHYYRGNFNIY